MIPRDQLFDKARALFWPTLLLVGNLLVVLGTDLAYDEAYYWVFSRHLDWGYFDHPPMAALFVALTSRLVPGELGVRLTFALATQVAAWMMARMVPRDRAWQVWAGFSLFPLLAFAGVFAIPDGPLVVMSVFWLWSLKRGLEKDDWFNAALVGVASACLLYSKYHGVLYMVGTLIALPSLLRRPTFWAAVIFAVILFAPHVYWQYEHDFSTLRYHFIDRPKVGLGWKSPLEFILSQLFLMGLLAGPLLWRAVFRNKSTTEFDRVLKVLTLFIPVFFFFSSLNKKIEANWTVAAGLPMILFLVRQASLDLQNKWIKNLAVVSLVLVFLGRVVMVVPPSWHGLKRSGEFHGWQEWSNTVQEKAGDECVLMANRYQIASKLSFYLQKDVTALNVASRLNQFEYWDQHLGHENDPICWVTQLKTYPGEPVPTPDGKNLILVKGVSLGDILSRKDKSL